jgi:broad specificity phosphatase PhoE
VTRLVLCRHADPARPDGPAELALALRPVALDELYTSPLERALVTARAIADGRGLTPLVVDDLREVERGEVEGLAFEQYPAALQDDLLRDPAAAVFPGGESIADVRARVTRAVEAILARHPGATVAIVAHAGPIRALLAHWLGIDGVGAFRLDQRFGAVNVVDWAEGTPFVRLVNGRSVDVG